MAAGYRLRHPGLRSPLSSRRFLPAGAVAAARAGAARHRAPAEPEDLLHRLGGSGWAALRWCILPREVRTEQLLAN